VKLRYLKNRVPSAIRRATVIATPSNYVRESIEQNFDIERARTAVVRHGVEPAIGAHKTPEHELRARFNLGNSRVLLIPAITHPHKNHEFLLRLLANEWRNEDVKLVMVGGNGLAESRVQSLIIELGVASKVVRSGRVQAADRDGLIALAEALVFPSKFEGFGAPVLEAMALGTPVISSDCASLPEVVGDGGLVLPLTPEAWAGALSIVRAQRSSLVHNGLRRAEEFSSAKSAQDLVIAYEKTLAAVAR
jgi:alpha-1,3-rhamnosyl/mannosyltransferase